MWFTYKKNMNPNLHKLTADDWEKKFKKYDKDHNGLISAKELQQLLFKEFAGFLTVRQAKTYIHLINSKKNDEMGLEDLIQMKPIIFVLSQRTIRKDLPGSIRIADHDTISGEAFVNINMNLSSFKNLFSNEEEFKELLKLIDQKKNRSIKMKKVHDTQEMLGESIEMARIHQQFLIFGRGMNFHEYICQCHNIPRNLW
ncbi:uncharacterized protein LOC126842522 [Adelges cooleyi]|uniref:uncharacterized protein LOC126842522 n=1 Tax=Adelges cooleyi TaxID=133065 RepID=UPI0021808BA3|nr:uncharacterized protein LOC126842522 [Adelges cooleyi]